MSQGQSPLIGFQMVQHFQSPLLGTSDLDLSLINSSTLDAQHVHRCVGKRRADSFGKSLLTLPDYALSLAIDTATTWNGRGGARRVGSHDADSSKHFSNTRGYLQTTFYDLKESLRENSDRCARVNNSGHFSVKRGQCPYVKSSTMVSASNLQ